MAATKTKSPVRTTLQKVPGITAIFWLIKILTTGMGEAFSDYLGTGNLIIGGLIGVGGCSLAVWLQFRGDRYQAFRYWFAIAMVAVFGTMAADVLKVALGLPYIATTVFYLAAVVVLFTLWYRSEGTLSIHSIVTARREKFYWATVLATFALGTAAGDLTADELHFGYFASAVIFAIAILVPFVAWWKFHLNEVIAFWMAYVLTRPLGASIADWLGKPAERSGLGWGDGTVSLIATVLIIGLVAYLSTSKIDIQHRVGAEA